MSGKYIVRQPIKDVSGNIIGNEILYHGANQAFSSDTSTSDSEQRKVAEGLPELYDLHHHAADEKDPPPL